MDFWEDWHICLDKCLSTYTEILLLFWTTLKVIYLNSSYLSLCGLFFFYPEVSFLNVEVEVEHDQHMNHYCVSQLLKVGF